MQKAKCSLVDVLCYCNNFLITCTIDLYAKYPEEVTRAAVFCGVHVRRRGATLPCQETSAVA